MIYWLEFQGDINMNIYKNDFILYLSHTKTNTVFWVLLLSTCTHTHLSVYISLNICCRIIQTKWFKLILRVSAWMSLLSRKFSIPVLRCPSSIVSLCHVLFPWGHLLCANALLCFPCQPLSPEGRRSVLSPRSTSLGLQAPSLQPGSRLLGLWVLSFICERVIGPTKYF